MTGNQITSPAAIEATIEELMKASALGCVLLDGRMQSISNSNILQK
jgi:hypothetical protein